MFTHFQYLLSSLVQMSVELPPNTASLDPAKPAILPRSNFKNLSAMATAKSSCW